MNIELVKQLESVQQMAHQMPMPGDLTQKWIEALNSINSYQYEAV